MNDGTSFDREWRGNQGASAITQVRQNSRTNGASMLGGPPITGGLLGPPIGSMVGGRALTQQPHQTEEDRRAAREVRAARSEALRNPPPAVDARLLTRAAGVISACAGS